MADQGVNNGRRNFLTATTAVVGGIGGIAAAVPFLKSWKPSERAKLLGAPVLADISKLEPGAIMRVMWRGSPVWVVNRTPEMIAGIASMDGELKDPKQENTEQQPEYAKNATRAIKDQYLVLVGVCTHLGCSPSFVPELSGKDFGDQKVGFYCPCHNSKFDMAGRVTSDSPAPDNLLVPPYHFVDDKHVMIGVDPQQGAA